MAFQTLLQITVLQDSIQDAAATAAEVISHEETLSVFALIVGGGWYIMAPLFALSAIAIYLFIERFLVIQKASKLEQKFMHQVADFVHDNKAEALRTYCLSFKGPFYNMIAKGALKMGKPINEIRTAIENVARLEVSQLERNLGTVATIAGAAPMIGFLGTVVGMIRTFHSMYTSGNSVNVELLAGGIMQALVTTVAGLVIGIIAYIAYNILVVKVENVANKMEEVAVDFIDMIEK